MPRACTICTHTDHEAIDKALVGSDGSIRQIATQFDVSEAAVRRHRKHIAKTLDKAQEKAEIAHGADLLDRLEQAEQRTVELAQEALTILAEAKQGGNLNTALRSVEVALKAQARQDARTELVAKLRGLIESGTKVQVGVQVQTVEQDSRDFEEAAQVLEGFLSGTDPQLLAPAGGLPEPVEEPAIEVVEVEPEPAPPITIRWPDQIEGG